MADPGPGERSYRQILRSSSIVGGASIAQIVFGLIRMKAAALLVGLAGVGLIGLFTNLIATAATVGGMGIGNAATRQIASERSRNGPRGEAAARRALAIATAILAILTAAALWLFSEPIAQVAFGDAANAEAISWLGIGAGLTIVASSQTALLAGVREMAALARTVIISGFLATAAGIAALWLFGPRALVFFVIVPSLANVIAGGWFVARLPRPVSTGEPHSLWPHWRLFATLGMALMLGQLLANGSQLAARALIQQRLGLTELGLFQAAWAISTTYLGIVLQAMSADYYPRLSEAIREPRTAVRIVKEQTEVALFLGAPIILGGLALAPLALEILYSSAFRPAAELLRWQILGDVLKIAGWPMGYVLLAANRGRTFLLVEAVGWTAFLATTVFLIPYVGLEAAGIGYLVMYVLYFPAVLITARRITGPIWTLDVIGHMLIVAATAVAVFVTATYRPLVGTIAGLVAALVFAAVGAAKLRRRIRAENPA